VEGRETRGSTKLWEQKTLPEG